MVDKKKEGILLRLSNGIHKPPLFLQFQEFRNRFVQRDQVTFCLRRLVVAIPDVDRAGILLLSSNNW
jgi:hypothetical protein